MVKEYIDREALREEIDSLSVTLCGKELFGELAKFSVEQKIDKMPSADVVEVVHGKWEVSGLGNIYFCSECEYFAMPRQARAWKYCPNCGAKMDGERKEV